MNKILLFTCYMQVTCASCILAKYIHINVMLRIQINRFIERNIHIYMHKL